MKRQALVFNLANLLILLPLFGLSLSVGVAEFHWSRIFSSADSMQLMLISRLPRTFAVVLSGASLGGFPAPALSLHFMVSPQRGEEVLTRARDQ